MKRLPKHVATLEAENALYEKHGDEIYEWETDINGVPIKPEEPVDKKETE